MTCPISLDTDTADLQGPGTQRGSADLRHSTSPPLRLIIGDQLTDV
ncbi:MAG: hypothetical protein ACYDDU_12380 [Dermatophilaceae bacterium]